MSEWAQKRFWTKAKAVALENGFGVSLDGRSVKTPAKAAFVVPTRSLADEIAQEWDAQEELLNPLSMPFTRAVNAAIDKVSQQHSEVAGLIAAYGESDLLCYRAASPKELVQRQEEQWSPLLDWAHQTFGVQLSVGQGVMHVAQNPTNIHTLAEQVFRLSSFELAAFHDLVSLSGSLIIGLSAIHAHAKAEDLWKISRLDELWQEEQWGEDEEATALAETKRKAFLDAHRFYFLLQN